MFGPVAKVLGIVVLVAGGLLLLDRVEEFLGVQSLDTEGQEAAFEETTEASDGGGSSFKSVPPTSPGRFAWSIVTVLFRPFPYEAGNLQALTASAESMLLLVMGFFALPRMLSLLSNIRRKTYPLLSIVYILVFCYAFASISNFGILTRQRVQVLPFILVLLCLPRPLAVTAPAASPAPGVARASG